MSVKRCAGRWLAATLLAWGTGTALGADSPLVGHTWQLGKFIGKDDSTIVPDNRSRYTLRFDADGTLTVQADCNRGTGSWKATEAELQLGPIGTTLMLCRPGSMSERFLRDIGDVRSYVIRDGKLALALKADGGTYEFVPVGAGSAAGPAPPAPPAAPPGGAPRKTPSADCARFAPDTLEALICVDPMLTALDGELTRLFKLAARAKGNAAAAVRSDQGAWLKQRNACTRVPAAAACLRERYLQRIVDLRAGSGAARGEDDRGISSGPFAFACEGIDGPVNVSFVRTDPSLVHIQDKTGTWLMEQRPSGSGARYEGATASEMFWNKGDEAMFNRGEGQPETKCRRQVVR